MRSDRISPHPADIPPPASARGPSTASPVPPKIAARGRSILKRYSAKRKVALLKGNPFRMVFTANVWQSLKLPLFRWLLLLHGVI